MPAALEAFTVEEQAEFDSMKAADQAPVQPAEVKAPPAAITEPPKPEDGEKPDSNGMVPHGRYHEERERRKQFQKERDDLVAERNKSQGRLDILEKLIRDASAPAKPAEIQVPDVNADPVGHFRAEVERLNRQNQELLNWRQQQDQQTQVQTNVQRIAQIAGAHETEFKKTNPDYEEASNFLRGLEDARLQAMGFSDPAQRFQMINQRVLEVAVTALQQNRNAAQVVYDMAKATGYKAKAATQQQQPNPDQQKIEMAAKGQKAGGGLGTVNGSAPATPTLTALANLSDDEFAKATAGGNWKKLMETLGR